MFDDRNLGENEFFEESRLTENLYNFINRLPEEYKEKQDIQALINEAPVNKQNISIADYGKQLQKTINDTQR